MRTRTSPTSISLSTKAKRRPRTTPAQRKLLQTAFQEDPYPSKERQRTLAADVGFSVESLHFWFQNQRQLMRRQAKDSKQRMDASGEEEGSAPAAEPVLTLDPPGLEQGPFPQPNMVVSAPSSAVSRTSHQHQERYTFYSSNQPLASHMSALSTSEDVGHLGFYAAGTDGQGFHPQQQQQQQQHLRLPPFSTLVSHQEHRETADMIDPVTGTTAAATETTSARASEFSNAPSAFTPTRPVPLPSSMASTSGSPSMLVVHHRGPSPGSAGHPPIPFFFHHPEYGIEACMRQLSSQYERTPSNRNMHRY